MLLQYCKSGGHENKAIFITSQLNARFENFSSKLIVGEELLASR